MVFARIFKQWAEEVVVNKLAESKAFQKAAVSVVKASESAQAAVEAGVKDPAKVKEVGASLWAALQKEVQKDLGKWGAASGGGSKKLS